MSLSTPQILALGAPAICFLLSLGFLCTWVYVRSHRHLLLFSASFAIYALGVMSQILQWPSDSGWNAATSATLYLISALLLARGILARSRARFDTIILIATAAATLEAIIYFYYVEPDVVVRIYALNFGVAGIFLLSALRLSDLRRGKPIDRALYWVFVALALSFIPRTILTTGSAVTQSLAEFGHSPFWLALQLALVLLGVALALTLFAASMVDIIDLLRQEKNTDPLTLLSNRRSFEEFALSKNSNRFQRPTSLAIFDIDHFKTINDTYGHIAGDAVLAEFGKLVRHCTRANDRAWRVGGEEFIVLLPHTDIAGAVHFVERIRRLLSRISISVPPDTVAITASFGIAQLGQNESLRELVARADALLYAAKRGGRNRIVAERKQQDQSADHGFRRNAGRDIWERAGIIKAPVL